MYQAIRLAISGSGTRYPVQIGALCEFTDMGISIVEAVTTSGGTVAGAAKAALQTSAKMEQMACDVLPRDHLDPNWWPFGGTRGGFAGKKFREAFRKHLGSKIEHLIAPRLHIATTNWTRGTTVVHKAGDLPLCIGASMCLPVFDMVEIEGELYEDGGAGGANFLLDYQGWHHPKDDLPMIGLCVRGAETSVIRERPRTKLDRLIGTIEDLIAANDREHIEDAHWAQVITLETKAPRSESLHGPRRGTSDDQRRAPSRPESQARRQARLSDSHARSQLQDALRFPHERARHC